MSFDVDAVITWVDGNDPAYQNKLKEYLRESGNGSKAAAKPTRFNDCGELEYCIASLLRFAPWLRTIYIVSDQQTPPFMAELKESAYADRVRLIDHREIFTGFEQYLPTFSNRSIECMLWRIPGLAERFIYLNDDFQLIQPVSVDDFFREDSIVLRGKWYPAHEKRWSSRLKLAVAKFLPGGKNLIANTRPGNHAAQFLSARLAGFKEKYFQAPHLPHPMRKSMLSQFFSEHADLHKHNAGFRLRSNEQFLSTSLAAHLALARNLAVIDNRLKTLRLSPSSQSPSTLRKQFRKTDTKTEFTFSCVQSLDKAAITERGLIIDWFNQRIGRLADIIAKPA
ncbi:MAG: stealth family protein [Arenimonas sp.]